MTEYRLERTGCALRCWAAGTHGATVDGRIWASRVDAVDDPAVCNTAVLARLAEVA